MHVRLHIMKDFNHNHKNLADRNNGCRKTVRDTFEDSQTQIHKLKKKKTKTDTDRHRKVQADPDTEGDWRWVEYCGVS